MFVHTVHHVDDLLEGGTLVNNSSFSITGYLIGWNIFFASGGTPETHLAEWVPVFGGLEENGRVKIPSHRVSVPLENNHVVKVEFFVAGVKFPDGSIWRSAELKQKEIEARGAPLK